MRIREGCANRRNAILCRRSPLLSLFWRRKCACACIDYQHHSAHIRMCYSWLLFGVGPSILTLCIDVSIFIARPMFGFVKYILLKYSQPQLISSVISIGFIFAQSTKVFVRGRVSVQKWKTFACFISIHFCIIFFCILLIYLILAQFLILIF